MNRRRFLSLLPVAAVLSRWRMPVDPYRELNYVTLPSIDRQKLADDIFRPDPFYEWMKARG